MLVEEPKPESCVGFLFMCLFVVSPGIIGYSLGSMFGVLEEMSLKLSLFMLDIKFVGDRLFCIKLVPAII